MNPPRAALILDDSPQHVASVLALLRAEGQAPSAAVHVVCSSARTAERIAPALRRMTARWPAGIEDRKEPRGAGGLVAGPTYVHVLGGEQGRAARDADCCLRAANWLFDLVRDIHRHGLAIDAIAGPNGPLRATLLRGAIESAGTACDRLYLLRLTRAGGPAARGKRSKDAGALLLVKHVPPSRRDHDHPDKSYADVVTRRTREWGVIADPEPVIVDLARRKVWIGPTEVSLTPDQTFWYGAFAMAPGRIFPHRNFGSVLKLNAQGEPELTVPPTTAEGTEMHGWLRHLQLTFQRTQPNGGDRFGRLLLNACDLTAPQLGAMLAKIAGALHSAVGAAAEPYCVRALKGSGYRLDLPARLVTVKAPAVRTERLA